MYSLSGSWIKLRRAQEHLASLNDEIDGFIKSKPYSFPVEPNPTPPDYLMRVRIHNKPRAEWGALIGDVAHNARSALDLIVSDISQLRKRDRARFGLQFPIFDHRRGRFYGRRRVTGYIERENRYLAGVRPEHRAVIERYQPYKRRDFTNDVLGILGHINDADKHRLIHVATAIGHVRLSPQPVTPGQPADLGGVRIRGRVTIAGHVRMGNIDIEVLNWGLITSDNAPIARFTIPETVQVQMEPNVGLAIKFDKGEPRIQGRPVVDILTAILNRIEEVLRNF